MDNRQIITNSIITDMSEGVMAIRFDGKIELVNDAALAILARTREELEGHSFARCFFDGEDPAAGGGNDAFTECVLDVIYSKARRQERYVPYRAEGRVRQLRIVSSFLKKEETTIGVILTLSDITELTEMRDAVKAMETIQGLNRELELRNRVLQETFGRYLSEDIVKEILDTPGGWKLGGQKRVLTVLMSDLRGFTMMCEHMDPGDMVSMLNHYFTVMYGEISRYRGTLIEFLGDGMFVIFGAPVRTDTHASDAVAAALGMQRRMREVNEWNAAHGYPELTMGIGINTDEMILGNLGSDRRTKYGVMGAAVNLAGRLESCSAGGQVIITPSTRAMTGSPLVIADTMLVSAKGVKDPVEAAVVTGIGAPYEVYLPRDEAAEDPPRPLPAPVRVRYRVLRGKIVDPAELEGKITALSARGALLETPPSEQSGRPDSEAGRGTAREDENRAARSWKTANPSSEVSEDAAPGEGETGADGAFPENIMLEVGDGLYARVARREGDCLILRFTAKPEDFLQWLSACGCAGQ